MCLELRPRALVSDFRLLLHTASVAEVTTAGEPV